ncbi:hypothetical protein D3C73_1334810 [compost metagenome]
MLHRFIDVAIRDHLDYFTVFNRREYVDGLQRYIICIKHTAGNMVILETNVVLKMRQNLVQQTTIHHLAGFGNDFTRVRIDQRLSKTLVEQTVFDMQLFIDFVTTDIGQIVTFWIEEAGHEQALRIF